MKRVDIALTHCLEALRERPQDRVFAFNAATAYAELGDSDGFLRMAAVFSNSTLPMEQDITWWHGLLDDESKWFAPLMGWPADHIRQLFRLPGEPEPSLVS